MEHTKADMEPKGLKVGTVGHYQHLVSEYERIKTLAENTIGETADELYHELDGIRMVLEEYEI